MSDQGTGIKHDHQKRRYNLIPFDAMDKVADVFTQGANKYEDRNWESGLRWGRLSSAAMRHISAWEQGQDNDDEWGFSHIAHAICCLLMLLALTLRKKGEDDRVLHRKPEIDELGICFSHGISGCLMCKCR